MAIISRAPAPSAPGTTWAHPPAAPASSGRVRLRAEADALDSETVSAAENLDHVIQNLNRKFAEGPCACGFARVRA